MDTLVGKNILILMPRNQFCEEELVPLQQQLNALGARVITLSLTGKEATGSLKNKYTPDGMIVDWDKQEGIVEKYNAVLAVGGKGAPKSLWNDPIVPQIVTDHYRLGRVVGAIGLGVGVLARSNLLDGDTAVPDHEALVALVEDAGGMPVEEDLVVCDRLITARDHQSVDEFVNAVVRALLEAS